MQTETDESAKSGEIIQAPNPIDKVIGIVEDAGVALGFAKRIYESARAVFGSKTPVRDIMDDAGARAAKARAEFDARKKSS